MEKIDETIKENWPKLISKFGFRFEARPTVGPFDNLGYETECYESEIGCRELEPINVLLRELKPIKVLLRVTNPNVDSKGTILLTSGGLGTSFYCGEDSSKMGEPMRWMVTALLNDGFKLVEIKWSPESIWALPSDNRGYISYGARTLACRYACVANEVHENQEIHKPDSFFAAQGNSAGSAQIAFSLCYYGLEKILRLANLGGGPPPCPRARQELYTSKDPMIQFKERNSIQTEQRWSVLAIQGVAGKEWAERAEPLLSGDPNLKYPNTTVRFFLGEREPNLFIVETAMAYFEAIQAKRKDIQTVMNTGHKIVGTIEGVRAMVDSIREAAGILSPP